MDYSFQKQIKPKDDLDKITYIQLGTEFGVDIARKGVNWDWIGTSITFPIEPSFIYLGSDKEDALVSLQR